MDGKWKWPIVLLLFVCALPKMLWLKLFPPQPSPMAEYLQQQQKRALEQRRWNDLTYPTPEEEEAWQRMERRS